MPQAPQVNLPVVTQTLTAEADGIIKTPDLGGFAEPIRAIPGAPIGGVPNGAGTVLDFRGGTSGSGTLSGTVLYRIRNPR